MIVINQPRVSNHKFENLKEIAVAKLKCRPIIDQTGILADHSAKAILDYLRPLC